MPPSPWSVPVGASALYDLEEINRALRVYLDPEGTHVLQSSPSWRPFAASMGSPLSAEVLSDVCAGTSVYVTLNPVTPGYAVKLSGKRPPSFNNTDIERRQWILFDADRIKTEETRTLSSTEEEKARAWELLSLVMHRLRGKGWPDPVWSDSGNGFHALYPIDLPNDKLSRAIVGAILKRIHKEVTLPGAEIDTTVCDAKRVVKLPGTWVRKGEDSPERPHRMAKVLFIPEVFTPVPLELLKEEAGISGDGETEVSRPISVSPGWSVPVAQPVDDGKAYARGALEKELGKLLTTSDHRNDALNKAAFNLGQLVSSGKLPEDEVRKALETAGQAIGLGLDGDPGEIARAIANGIGAGKEHPREVPPRPVPSVNGHHANGTGTPAKLEDFDRVITWASEFTPRPVEWLWPNKIPIGKLTTWAGWGNLGKSFVTMDLAARVSQGEEIPGEQGLCFDRGKVLVLNSEDDPDDTMTPRLMEAGADLSRVAVLRSEVLGRFTLEDIPVLDRAISEMGGASLVIIDPVTSHLGRVKDNNNAEVQSLLIHLSLWAMKARVAVVLVTHVNKPTAGRVEAMARVCGSIAFVNKVRAAVMFAADPKDPTKERRLMIPFKNNSGAPSSGLSYRIVPTETLARVEWLGPVDTSADEAMQGKRGPRAEKSPEEVELWLLNWFSETSRVASQIIFDHAKQEGISDRYLKAAKSKLSIKASKGETEDGRQCWFWVLPPHQSIPAGQGDQLPASTPY